jgi:hypothetical protein
MKAVTTGRQLRIDAARSCRRIDELAHIGAIEGGGVCLLASSDEDGRARGLVRDRKPGKACSRTNCDAALRTSR